MKFWTDNTLSLIQIGRGYWKYTPRKEHIHFETQYDYDTRFGRIGNVIDFYMFRPLLGWATAWSFDALKLWLEKGLHPRLLIRRTMTYWLVCFYLHLYGCIKDLPKNNFQSSRRDEDAFCDY